MVKMQFYSMPLEVSYEFPELRRLAHQEYLDWNPDIVLIEAKASGIPLIHELRQMDIPVTDFTPSKGNDKHVRMNSIAHLFEHGKNLGA